MLMSLHLNLILTGRKSGGIIITAKSPIRVNKKLLTGEFPQISF